MDFRIFFLVVVAIPWISATISVPQIVRSQSRFANDFWQRILRNRLNLIRGQLEGLPLKFNDVVSLKNDISALNATVNDILNRLSKLSNPTANAPPGGSAPVVIPANNRPDLINPNPVVPNENDLNDILSLIGLYYLKTKPFDSNAENILVNNGIKLPLDNSRNNNVKPATRPPLFIPPFPPCNKIKSVVKIPIAKIPSVNTIRKVRGN